MAARRSRLGKLRKRLGLWSRGARNALELLREGRIAAPYAAPYEVVASDPRFRLRRYERPADVEPVSAPLVLVPPLMVTSEIYDISPELSAVSALAARGVDVWVVDFGRPEDEEGGLSRTLDDHVLAVDAAIDVARRESGRDVHLAGYSQGGMFCYQAAAFRKSEGIASVVTFGSPVDIHRNLPVKVDDSLAERFIRLARGAIEGPLGELQGLPGSLTSRGFKLLAPRQEIKHLLGLFGLLHDREALARREPKRRFLGGEGFVAWPGPALRDFIDQVVVDNRMTSGGLVIDGRTVSLADITCPVLTFVGLKDDMARPASVRAIRRAAPKAEVHEVTLRAGHFGLVVGSAAMSVTWPTVFEWIGWRAGDGDKPEALDAEAAEPKRDVRARVSLLYDLAGDLVDGLWQRLGDMSGEVAGVLDTVRWQLPRLARLESLEDDTRVSLGLALAEQAAAIPDEPFFLWGGRAYTYAQADRRVSQMAQALHAAGVREGEHVGVLMDNQPDYLTVVAALSRLSAVGVLLNAGARGRSLAQATQAGSVARLVVDVPHLDGAPELPLLVVVPPGGQRPAGAPAPLHADGIAAGAEDLTVWDASVARWRVVGEPRLPASLEPNASKASDTTLLMFTSGTTGLPKAARITNRRWAVAALGTAAACMLTPRDTVYCCLPLHHATGMLVAVGGALVGGSRLALAERFSASGFWEDVRRTGSTVVFYVGELCRYLVKAPPGEADKRHPVRLFAGNGMRPHVWERLLERHGPFRVLEFYGATEGNAVLANLSGDKVGSVGRPVFGEGEVALVAFDPATGRALRGADGRAMRVADGKPGLLLSRISDAHPLTRFDGYEDEAATEAKVLEGVFADGDRWFDTGDLLRRDVDGDFWFVDRVGDTFRWKGENVSTEQVADVVSLISGVALAVVYGVELPDREGRAGMAAVELEAGAELDGAEAFRVVAEHLFPAARPRFLRVVDHVETTETLKFDRQRLQEQGADPGRTSDALFWYDEAGERYAPLDLERYYAIVAES